MFSKTAALGLAAALALLTSAPAFAGTQDWKVDSSHSYGEVATQAKVNDSGQSVTLGAAKVTGTLRLDPRKISNSSFEFDADPSGSSPELGNYTVLRFRSHSAQLTSDGKLRVTGPLTVTQIELDPQIAGSNESYSAPQFVGRKVKETTKEQSFLLTLPAGDLVNAQGQATADASAEAKISAEDFPELVAAVLSTNWPAISNVESCTAAGNAGAEDYSGYTCAGSSVGQRSITRTVRSIGEDYPGEDVVVQAGNMVTLALHLRLTQQNADLSANSGQ
jgi:hypothetical protein